MPKTPPPPKRLKQSEVTDFFGKPHPSTTKDVNSLRDLKISENFIGLTDPSGENYDIDEVYSDEELKCAHRSKSEVSAGCSEEVGKTSVYSRAVAGAMVDKGDQVAIDIDCDDSLNSPDFQEHGDNESDDNINPAGVVKGTIESHDSQCSLQLGNAGSSQEVRVVQASSKGCTKTPSPDDSDDEILRSLRAGPSKSLQTKSVKSFYGKAPENYTVFKIQKPTEMPRKIKSPEGLGGRKKQQEPEEVIKVNSLPVSYDDCDDAGIPQDMPRFPDHIRWRPEPLENNGDHTVMVKGPYNPSSESPLPPDSSSLRDKWDNYHVKMPFSKHSKYTNEEGVEVQRWQLIEKSLLAGIYSFCDLKDAVESYNGGYRWNFSALMDMFENDFEEDEVEHFLDSLLPSIINLGLNLPNLLTRGLPLLSAGCSHSITLSQQQISSLLANAFLCTFPRRNSYSKTSQYANYPSINMATLFNNGFQSKEARKQSRVEKIKCLLNYFRRVCAKAPVGNVTFERKKLCDCPQWEESAEAFSRVHVTSEGLIENDGRGMLMVDFANKRIGGGVLKDGCVQEEILCIIYPELLVARLFSEALEEDEALVITGVERFNKYSGYSNTFKWEGNVKDTTERDSWGRRYTQFVAIDAMAHRGTLAKKSQFTIPKVDRELNKAYCGFECSSQSSIATGNWGCGAYGGDPKLKFLLQWMAASQTKRPMVYFTFNDAQLMCELRALVSLVKAQDISVGDMYMLLKRYDRLYISSGRRNYPVLYDFIYTTYYPCDSSD